MKFNRLQQDGEETFILEMSATEVARIYELCGSVINWSSSLPFDDVEVDKRRGRFCRDIHDVTRDYRYYFREEL